MGKAEDEAEAIRRIEYFNSGGTIEISLRSLESLEKIPHQLISSPRLSSLKILDLSGTQISDISPLNRIHWLKSLDLSDCPIRDYSVLSDLYDLRYLYLSRTGFKDASQLSGLANLKGVSLDGTRVRSVDPFINLHELERLFLQDTQISDLRPILFTGVASKHPDVDVGVSFQNTPFANGSSKLDRLSKQAHGKRSTKALLAYLQTLPPYPNPLPWETLSNEPETPQIDEVPRILIASERVDLDHSTATEDDQNDPITKRLYKRLPDEANALKRHTNRYPDADGPARALSKHVDVPFEEADIMDIHLEIAALTDLVALDATKPDAEQMDAECIAAINAVTRIGVPITMDNPDVLLFEKRSVDYARTRRAKAQADAEAAITAGLAKDKALATDRARETSELISTAPADGRVADYRSSFTRNVVIAAATIMGALGDAAIGQSQVRPSRRQQSSSCFTSKQSLQRRQAGAKQVTLGRNTLSIARNRSLTTQSVTKRAAFAP